MIWWDICGSSIQLGCIYWEQGPWSKKGWWWIICSSVGLRSGRSRLKFPLFHEGLLGDFKPVIHSQPQPSSRDCYKNKMEVENYFSLFGSLVRRNVMYKWSKVMEVNAIISSRCNFIPMYSYVSDNRNRRWGPPFSL